MTPEEALRHIVALADNADSPAHSMQGCTNAWASLGAEAVRVAREALAASAPTRAPKD
jgi:hypothetical protein